MQSDGAAASLRLGRKTMREWGGRAQGAAWDGASDRCPPVPPPWAILWNCLGQKRALRPSRLGASRRSGRSSVLCSWPGLFCAGSVRAQVRAQLGEEAAFRNIGADPGTKTVRGVKGKNLFSPETNRVEPVLQSGLVRCKPSCLGFPLLFPHSKQFWGFFLCQNCLGKLGNRKGTRLFFIQQIK